MKKTMMMFAIGAFLAGAGIPMLHGQGRPIPAPPNPIPSPGSVQMPKTPPPQTPPAPKIEGPKVGPGTITPKFNPPGVEYKIALPAK